MTVIDLYYSISKETNIYKEFDYLDFLDYRKIAIVDLQSTR